MIEKNEENWDIRKEARLTDSWVDEAAALLVAELLDPEPCVPEGLMLSLM